MRRTIVFGDAHGCIEQIYNLMEKVGLNEGDRVIALGDFVDRGPDSPACTEFVRQHESIMGNHEYKHVRKILSKSQRGARAQFITQGGKVYYDAAVTFMASLPFYLELDEAILVHAGLEYGTPLDEQDRIVLVGGTSRRRITGTDDSTGLPYWCASYPRDAKPVLFGHLKATGGIPRQGNLFPLDTGCVPGNMLTGLTLPDFKLYQVPGWQR